MRKYYARGWTVGVCTAAAAAAGFACGAGAAQAAPIQVGPGGAGENFASLPPADRWATVGLPGSATPDTEAQLDTAIQAVAATSVNTQLVSTATTPPGTNGLGQHHTTAQYAVSRPTGNIGVAIIGKLQNAAGGAATGLNLSYDLGLIVGANATSEGVPGHRIYYSTTGAANSWTTVGTVGYQGASNTTTSQPQNVPITVAGGWAENGDLYVAWVDDNDGTGDDGTYTLDNITFTATGVVPEPSALALVGLAGIGLLRRGRR